MAKSWVDRLEKFQVSPDGCWLWTGALISSGYGSVALGGRKSKKVLAHRLMYELTVGPIPTGYEVDHLCRVRRCVAPAHLEAVTPAENNRRMVAAVYGGTECKRGHSWDVHGRIHKAGFRYCGRCHRDRERERQRRVERTTE